MTNVHRRNFLMIGLGAMTTLAVGTTAASAQTRPQRRRVAARRPAPDRAPRTTGSVPAAAPQQLGRIEQPNAACLSLRQGSTQFVNLGCRTTAGRGGFVR